jgi:hypothetical protein
MRKEFAMRSAIDRMSIERERNLTERRKEEKIITFQGKIVQ